MSNQKHLTLEDRRTIEHALCEESPKTAIAKVLGKDSSTIGKEIRNHRQFEPPKKFQSSPGIRSGIKDCQFINAGCPLSRKCVNGKCLEPCDSPAPLPCKRRDKKVLVCNGCSEIKTCFKYHYIYDPEIANNDYRETLVDSRLGINMSQKELDELASKVVPRLLKGVSIEVICMDDSSITVSSRTVYNLLNDGYFKPYGADRFSARRMVNRKPRHRKQKLKVRKDNSYLKGRTYADYGKYVQEHPEAIIWQMDTVYNDGSNGPFIQTFIHPHSLFMVGILHDSKTSQDMLDGLKRIHDQLGHERFSEVFQVILTDRGTEFARADEMEALGCRLFYCDPMRSSQKPEVENNHILLRYICPKQTDLRKAGLQTQEDLDLIFSHINSYSRKSRMGKTPLEFIEFLLNDNTLASQLGICRIPAPEVWLKPSLIKK